ncbi:MAG TPA: hypothetical protein VK174_03270 [Chitinophagales bacterium]|nr:hypothetical protein [Chitinophagales bacterium]
MKKTLLLTFDYELYLGANSGSAQNCSLLPTDRILRILGKHNCTGVFFIDSLYLVRLKEVAHKHHEAKNDLDKVSEQIRRMVQEGHLVYDHIHPHWIDAKYDAATNTWNLSDKSKFALSNLTPAEQDYVFDSSLQVLYDIIKPVKPDYKINGYRAGGFFIQPFSIFKRQFLKHGIKYEFSVQAGAKCSGPDNSYAFDFTTSPDKSFYRFEEEVTREQSNGSFVQFPLRECKVEGWRKIYSGLHYRLTSRYKYYHRYGDGLPSGNQITFENAGAKSRFSHTEGFSIESMNAVKIDYYMQELENHNHLHIISHPKLVSDYTLDVLDKFLARVTNKFEIITHPALIAGQ